MEEVYLRFPHLGQQIFEQLDSENIVKCLKVNKPWKTFIENQPIRLVKFWYLNQFSHFQKYHKKNELDLDYYHQPYTFY